MGLLKGSLTFSRYRVMGETPADFASFVNRQIRKFAFQEFTSESEELSSGWTSIDNALDTGFSYANYALGDYLIFSLRIDKKNVPPSLLKLKAQEAEKAFLAEKQQERLYKEQRKQILDAVRMNLFSKALPTPSFFDVCWCVSKKWLIFGSHAEKVTDPFLKLFERTFQMKPHPFTPWNPDALEPPVSEKLASAADDIKTQFLGRDFLTWLWFKSEERNGAVSLEGEDIEIIFVRRIVLESGDGEYTETVSCQGIHSDMKEGKTALQAGKKIKEARIKLGRGNSECEFTLKADNFQIQSLKIPATIDQEEETDQDGRTLERIYHIERAMETMDRLFSLFLQRRLTEQWSSGDLPKMKKWFVAD